MKKQIKLFAFLLACAMMLTLAACAPKSYATVEEWYADNPSEKLSNTTFSEGSTKASVGVAVEGNVIIFKMNLGTKTIGKSALMDQVFTAVFDSSFGDEEKSRDLIQKVSAKSGVDASLISIRYEVYNPGELTPCYTKSYPE